jgi:hypothetical protein
MLPERGFELNHRLTFRLTEHELRQIANYAESIEAPVAYALRNLVRKGLHADAADRQAA